MTTASILRNHLQNAYRIARSPSLDRDGDIAKLAEALAFVLETVIDQYAEKAARPYNMEESNRG